MQTFSYDIVPADLKKFSSSFTGELEIVSPRATGRVVANVTTASANDQNSADNCANLLAQALAIGKQLRGSRAAYYEKISRQVEADPTAFTEALFSGEFQESEREQIDILAAVLVQHKRGGEPNEYLDSAWKELERRGVTREPANVDAVVKELTKMGPKPAILPRVQFVRPGDQTSGGSETVTETVTGHNHLLLQLQVPPVPPVPQVPQVPTVVVELAGEGSDPLGHFLSVEEILESLPTGVVKISFEYSDEPATEPRDLFNMAFDTLFDNSPEGLQQRFCFYASVLNTLYSDQSIMDADDIRGMLSITKLVNTTAVTCYAPMIADMASKAASEVRTSASETRLMSPYTKRPSMYNLHPKGGAENTSAYLRRKMRVLERMGEVLQGTVVGLWNIFSFAITGTFTIRQRLGMFVVSGSKIFTATHSDVLEAAKRYKESMKTIYSKFISPEDTEEQQPVAVPAERTRIAQLAARFTPARPLSPSKVRRQQGVLERKKFSDNEIQQLQFSKAIGQLAADCTTISLAGTPGATNHQRLMAHLFIAFCITAMWGGRVAALLLLGGFSEIIDIVPEFNAAISGAADVFENMKEFTPQLETVLDAVDGINAGSYTEIQLTELFANSEHVQTLQVTVDKLIQLATKQISVLDTAIDMSKIGEIHEALLKSTELTPAMQNLLSGVMRAHESGVSAEVVVELQKVSDLLPDMQVNGLDISSIGDVLQEVLASTRDKAIDGQPFLTFLKHLFNNYKDFWMQMTMTMFTLDVEKLSWFKMVWKESPLFFVWLTLASTTMTDFSWTTLRLGGMMLGIQTNKRLFYYQDVADQARGTVLALNNRSHFAHAFTIRSIEKAIKSRAYTNIQSQDPFLALDKIIARLSDVPEAASENLAGEISKFFSDVSSDSDTVKAKHELRLKTALHILKLTVKGDPEKKIPELTAEMKQLEPYARHRTTLRTTMKAMGIMKPFGTKGNTKQQELLPRARKWTMLLEILSQTTADPYIESRGSFCALPDHVCKYAAANRRVCDVFDMRVKKWRVKREAAKTTASNTDSGVSLEEALATSARDFDDILECRMIIPPSNLPGISWRKLFIKRGVRKMTVHVYNNNKFRETIFETPSENKLINSTAAAIEEYKCKLKETEYLFEQIYEMVSHNKLQLTKQSLARRLYYRYAGAGLVASMANQISTDNALRRAAVWYSGVDHITVSAAIAETKSVWKFGIRRTEGTGDRMCRGKNIDKVIAVFGERQAIKAAMQAAKAAKASKASKGGKGDQTAKRRGGDSGVRQSSKGLIITGLCFLFANALLASVA